MVTLSFKVLDINTSYIAINVELIFKKMLVSFNYLKDIFYLFPILIILKTLENTFFMCVKINIDKNGN